MTDSVIISEYVISGKKQVVLEKIKGELSYYRVFVVDRFNSLDAAKSLFLSEVSSYRKEYYRKEIGDYALKHNIKLQPEKAQAVEKKKPAPAKGRKRNAKSNAKTA